MKQLFISVLSVLSLIACNSSDRKDVFSVKDQANLIKNDKKEAKDERNKQVVKASTEGFIALDVEAVAKDFDPNILDYYDDSKAPVKGVDSFKYNCGKLFKSVKNMRGENLKYVADGDWVIVWGDWHWTNNATRKSTDLRIADIFKFDEEGKVIEHHGIGQPIVKPGKT